MIFSATYDFPLCFPHELIMSLRNKIEWFIDFPATNKINNLTCVDYHETH